MAINPRFDPKNGYKDRFSRFLLVSLIKVEFVRPKNGVTLYFRISTKNDSKMAINPGFDPKNGCKNRFLQFLLGSLISFSHQSRVCTTGKWCHT